MTNTETTTFTHTPSHPMMTALARIRDGAEKMRAKLMEYDNLPEMSESVEFGVAFAAFLTYSEAHEEIVHALAILGVDVPANLRIRPLGSV